MASKVGTIQLVVTATTKSLIVKDTPDYSFPDPLPAWFWEAIKGNAGAAINVTYTPGSPDTITGATVG